MTLANKTAVITGGGTGIGKATANLFAEEGANVVITGRRAHKLEEVVKDAESSGLSIDHFVCDVSDEKDCKAAVDYAIEKYGQIDILFNNAGVLIPGVTHETKTPDWEQTFNINVRGLWLLSKYVIPYMLERKHGSIVNNCSIIGLRGFKGASAYAASKGAVAQLTKSMALDYADKGIRVNAVCPGFVETPFVTEGYLKRAEDKKRAIEYMNSFHPMGRIADPKEIARAVVFLCDDKSSFITGYLMPIDGGWNAG